MTDVEELDYLEGSVFPASVVAVLSEEAQAVVRFAGDAEGLVPLSDFPAPDGDPSVSVGDEVKIYVEQKSNGSDRYVVSKDKADRLQLLDDIEQLFEEKKTIEGEIVAAIEGGFSVDIGVKAFLPSSQIGMRPVRDEDQVLGQSFKFKIIRMHKRRNNIVLSRRVLLEEERDRALDGIKIGALVDGTVKSFTDYGAFVDIGGIDGLLHVTDMSWGRVNHPSEVVTIGDPITVKVLKFDKKSKRISLGLRQIQEDPWEGARQRYKEGTEVEGPVISKTDYGCFIQLEQGVEGLVHSTGKIVTDATKERLRKVEIGESIKAVVIDTDIANKRISLALKD